MKRAVWLITGAVAVLAAAQWLRTPSVPYLVGSTVATAIAFAAALRYGAQRRRAPKRSAAPSVIAVATVEPTR